MVDMSKFPFFGGKECSPLTDALGVFCLPSFAREVCSIDPLLAAAWVSFDEEFNGSLIHPDNPSLFKGSKLDAAESQCLAALKETFRNEGMNAFAKALKDDTG